MLENSRNSWEHLLSTVSDITWNLEADIQHWPNRISPKLNNPQMKVQLKLNAYSSIVC